MSNQKSYPKTVEEMLEQGWYEKILRKVKKYQLNDILNTPEELVQDIFLQIIQSKYLERYNPEYRSFEVYIYTLVMNAVKKRGSREGSNGGKMIVNHYTLEQSQEENAEPTLGVVYLDRLENPVAQDMFEDVAMNDLIARTRESLKQFKASSSVLYHGKELQRDALTVFDFIIDGHTVPEIADIFQTSKQFIYILLEKIRSVPEMQDFYKDMDDGHRISDKGKRKKKTLQNATY